LFVEVTSSMHDGEDEMRDRFSLRGFSAAAIVGARAGLLLALQ
jgi:hypothetical protein